MKEWHGTFIGADPDLKGKTALLHSSGQAGVILAQFDDLSLPMSLTHGWPRFQESLFEIDEEDK